MLVPGGHTYRITWLYIMVVAVVFCLVFVFYRAETSPAHSTAPKSAPLHQVR
jgi:hypothetical protein